MKSHEQKIADAIASLTARLTSWDVDEPHDKAHEFVRDMLHNGWRPNARPIETPTDPPKCEDASGYITQARQAIQAARDLHADKEQ